MCMRVCVRARAYIVHAYMDIDTDIDIHVHNTLKEEKRILSKVSGFALPGELLAIMGPSGVARRKKCSPSKPMLHIPFTWGAQGWQDISAELPGCSNKPDERQPDIQFDPRLRPSLCSPRGRACRCALPATEGQNSLPLSSVALLTCISRFFICTYRAVSWTKKGDRVELPLAGPRRCCWNAILQKNIFYSRALSGCREMLLQLSAENGWQSASICDLAASKCTAQRSLC